MMSEFVKLCCDYLLVVESFGGAVDSSYHCYLVCSWLIKHVDLRV